MLDILEAITLVYACLLTGLFDIEIKQIITSGLYTGGPRPGFWTILLGSL